MALLLALGILAILPHRTESDISIGAVVQNGAWSGNLEPVIQRTVNVINIGAYKPEVGISPKMEINLTESFNIIQTSLQVCDHALRGISAVISFTSCSTAALLDSQSRSLDIPQVLLINEPCRQNGPGTPTIKMVPHFSNQNMALVDILTKQEWHEATILYDNSLSVLVLDDLIVRFSKASARIRAINVEEGRKKSGTFLAVLREIEAYRPIGIFVLVSQDTLKELYLAAKTLELFDMTHYWVVMEQNASPDTMAMLASNQSNLVLIRQLYPGSKSVGGRCEPLAYVPDPKGLWDNLTYTDAYVVDSVLVLASALKRMLEAEQTFKVSSLDCKDKPYPKLPYGSKLTTLIRETNISGISGNVAFSDGGYRTSTDFEICSSYHTTDDSLYRVGTWKGAGLLSVHDDQLFKNVFRDFAHGTLKVTMREAYPFVIITREANGTIYTGFCVDILNELAEYFKFNYTVHEPPDGKYGAPNDDGTWNGMVGMVKRAEVDFAVGPFTVTLLRESVIDFTQPIMEDGIGILTLKPEDSDKMFSIFKPFTPRAWGITAVVAIVVSALLFIVNRLSPYTDINRGKDGANPDEIRAASSLWVIYSSFVGQGSEPQPSAISGRIILGFWWVFMVLMIATYTADLAAFLTVTIALKPINSLKELTQQSEIKPLVKDSTNIYSLFKESKTGIYKSVWSMMDDTPSVTDNINALRYVETGGYAFMTDRSQLEYIVLNDCEKYALADEIFNTAGLAFVLPENSSFLSQFNYYIMRMQEAGLLEKWKQQWWPQSDQCSSSDRTSEADSLGLDSLSGPFLVYGIVAGIAILALMFEVLMKSKLMETFRPKIKFWNFVKNENMKAKITQNGHT